MCYEDLIFNLTYCKYISTFKCISDPIYFYRTIKTVNHVSKRKWGKLFNISRKVAKANNLFLENKKGGKVLSDIKRYTFNAYLTELKSVKIKSDKEYNEALNTLLKEKDFFDSIKSIDKKGKTLSMLLLSHKLKLSVLTKKLIDKQV